MRKKQNILDLVFTPILSVFIVALAILVFFIFLWILIILVKLLLGQLG